MLAFGQPSGWDRFDCAGSTRRWRLDDDGRIEVQGEGHPSRSWPGDVEQWAPLIVAKARKYGVAPLWIAAIMALETGGRPGLCRKNADGSCSRREGMGLMAMLLSTATMMAGRPVSEDELLHDYDLQIDLGAKLIAQLRDKYEGDFVKAAISYNAGSVRCGNGKTWELPHEPCPPTPWGVVMGCLRTSRASNPYCKPSAVEEGKFACPVDYPTVAIASYNAAHAQGWTLDGHTAPPPPLPNTPPVAVARSAMGTLATFSLGAAVGYYALRWALPKVA